MNTESQWSRQEACFACATHVWLTVNHNINVTSGVGCLFDLILYVPSTIFQLYQDRSSWVEPVISKD